MFRIIMYCFDFSYDTTLSAACHCLADQWAKVQVNWSLGVLVLPVPSGISIRSWPVQGY